MATLQTVSRILGSYCIVFSLYVKDVNGFLEQGIRRKRFFWLAVYIYVEFHNWCCI
jgi:hypothetical protein